MQLSLMLTVIMGAALALEEDFSGRYPFTGGRIVDGEEADIEDFPYVAALLGDGYRICDGSIIGPDLILTAAHCVERVIISDVSQLTIRVGSSRWDSGGQLIAAYEITYHRYYHNLAKFDYDIAVIQLEENITHPIAKPIPLADEGATYEAATWGLVLGWGVTSNGSREDPEILRKVQLPVARDSWCSIVYGRLFTERMVCVGFVSRGKDACNEEAGGPFVINGTAVGVASFGRGCMYPKFPGAYSKVAAYRPWIKENSEI